MGLDVEMKLKEGQTTQTDSGLSSEEEDLEVLSPDEDEAEPTEMEIVWGNVVKFVILHALALYSVTLLPSLSLASWVFMISSYIISGLLLHTPALAPLLLLFLLILLLILFLLLVLLLLLLRLLLALLLTSCLLPAWGITAGAHRLWAHRSYKVNHARQLFEILQILVW